MYWANDKPSTNGNSRDNVPQDPSLPNRSIKLLSISNNGVFQSPHVIHGTPIPRSTTPHVNYGTPILKSTTIAATRPQETANDNNYELPSCSSSKKNTNLRPGNAYIFNNDTFDISYPDREGSEADVHKLLEVFSKFKLKVELIQNATVNKIKETVGRLQKTDFSSISCVVIVILSHGTRHEEVLARDGMYNIDDDILFPIFENGTLTDKPKIMFIQACKGNRTVGGLEEDSVKPPKEYPNGDPSEVLKGYGTFEGYVSFRDTQTGTVFIQTLCKVLEEHGHTKCIRVVMDMVKLQVKQATRSIGTHKQIITSMSSLTMKYVFGDYV